MPIFFSLSAISCMSSSETISVSEIIDGDTFADRNDHRYRIHGVDTPEIYKPAFDEGPMDSLREYYAQKAKVFSQNFLTGKKVNFDKVSTDAYGRTVARVKADGNDISLALVANGLAIVEYISITPGNPYFTNDVNFYYDLLDAQKNAFDNRYGFWKDHLELKRIFP